MPSQSGRRSWRFYGVNKPGPGVSYYQGKTDAPEDAWVVKQLDHDAIVMRLYLLLALFDRRAGSYVDGLVQAAREGCERDPDEGDDAWAEFDWLWESRSAGERTQAVTHALDRRDDVTEARLLERMERDGLLKDGMTATDARSLLDG